MLYNIDLDEKKYEQPVREFIGRKIEEEKIITLYRQIGQVSNSLNTKYHTLS